MSEIKIGDKVEVINTLTFGHSIHIGMVGSVKNIIPDWEIEVYFGDFPAGVTQWVYYPTWEKWVKVIKE